MDVRTLAAPAILIAAIAVVVLAFGADDGQSQRQSVAAPAAPGASESSAADQPGGGVVQVDDRSEPAAEVVPADVDLPDLGPAPDLVALDGWLQADGIGSLDDLRGQVVVLQFWTFGCYNCKNTLPNLRQLYAHYGDRDDFEVVGVHAPEFSYEADPDNIAAAAVDLGVTWPIALDTDKRNFRSWQEGTNYWPRTYVIDQDGNLRFDRIGEGAYDGLNAAVAALLGDPEPLPGVTS